MAKLLAGKINLHVISQPFLLSFHSSGLTFANAFTIHSQAICFSKSKPVGAGVSTVLIITPRLPTSQKHHPQTHLPSLQELINWSCGEKLFKLFWLEKKSRSPGLIRISLCVVQSEEKKLHVDPYYNCSWSHCIWSCGHNLSGGWFPLNIVRLISK